MREIKFRAWDKIAKKFMWPWPDGFHLLGETTCFDLIGQQLKERSPEKNTQVYIEGLKSVAEAFKMLARPGVVFSKKQVRKIKRFARRQKRNTGGAQ